MDDKPHRDRNKRRVNRSECKGQLAGVSIDGQTGFRLARAVNLFLLVGRVSSESVEEQVRAAMSGSIMDLIPIIQG